MLASINPLGERARGNRWWVTAAAFGTASVAAGAAGGAGLGLAGSVLAPAGRVRWATLAAVVLAAVALDLTSRTPTHRRQVDERWVGRYRGRVYGAGFGVQLGVGITTVVTTATVYAVIVAAFLATSPAEGAAVGAAFGAARAGPLAAVGRADSPAALRTVLRRLNGWAAAATSASLVATGLIGGVALAAAAGH